MDWSGHNAANRAHINNIRYNAECALEAADAARSGNRNVMAGEHASSGGTHPKLPADFDEFQHNLLSIRDLLVVLYESLADGTDPGEQPRHCRRNSETSEFRKVRNLGDNPPEFSNFYTPYNKAFYDECPYNNLDPLQNEIRLLEIIMDHRHDSLEFKLHQNLALDDVKSMYMALSYCAGDPKVTEEVIVNGLTFNVFSTAYAALQEVHRSQQLALAEGKHVRCNIWLDQICIDQSDRIERSHQVELMREIYANAESVMVWLGHDTTDGSGARFLRQQLCLVADYHEQLRRGADEAQKLEQLNLYVVETTKAHFQSLNGLKLKNTVEGLTAFLSSPWWTRCWVVQELVVAKEARLVFGINSLDWFSFSVGIVILDKTFKHLQSIFTGELDNGSSLSEENSKTIDSMLDRYDSIAVFSFFDEVKKMWEESSKPSLTVMLEHSRGRESSDPRDRIFAFLGLVDSGYEIAVDYCHHKTSEESANAFKNLLTDTARRIIIQEGSLDILSHVELDARGDDNDLPSWVPDWTSPREGDVQLLYTNCSSIFQNFPYIGQKAYNVSKNTAIVHFGKEMPDGPYKYLSVQGFIIDEVAAANTFGEREGNESPIHMADRWERIIAQYQGNYLYLAQCKSIWGALWEVFTRGLLHKTKYQNDLTPEGMGQFDNEIASRLSGMMNGWRFFCSPKGYLGLATHRAQPTDLLCIILGAHVPYVIRKNGLYYSLVGEAYVHGLMDGEAMRWGELVHRMQTLTIS